MLPLDQLDVILAEGGVLVESEVKEVIKKNVIDGGVLRQAAKEGYLNVVKYIVEARTRFQLSFEENFKCSNDGAEDEDCNTPLHIAASKGHVSIVIYLISAGAFISKRNRYVETPLYLACREGHEDVVKFLLQVGTRIYSYFLRDEKIAIEHIASNGRPEIVECLLDAGAAEGCVLLNASKTGRDDIVNLILQRAGHFKRSFAGSFRECCRWGHISICKLFIHAGANVSGKLLHKAPIHFASSNGHLNIVELLVTHGADVDSVGAYSKTPLFYASEGGHLNVVEFLLKKNVQVTVPGRQVANPLNAAIEAGHIAIARLLRLHGAALNEGHALAQVIRKGRLLALQCLLTMGVDFNSLQHTNPMLLACESNRLEMVQFLLQRNASLDCRDVSGNTPLHLASKHSGSKKILKLLVTHGALVNAMNTRGETPLFMAPDCAVMKTLIDCGTDPNIVDVKGRTILHITKNYDIVDLLLSNAVLIDARTHFGKTPLHYACLTGSKNIVELLLESGASSNALDRQGTSPLKEALNEGHVEVAELLCENDADVNARQGQEGPTILHVLSRAGNAKCVIFLLKWGAEVNLRDVIGNTPLHVATVARSFRVVQILTDYGAEVNAINNHNQSPLHLASKGEIAKILLQGGADPNLKDSFGRTALHVAQRKQLEEVVSVLQQHVYEHLE